MAADRPTWPPAYCADETAGINEGANEEWKMVWLAVILFLGAGILTYVLLTREKKVQAPEAFYVCDICGEHDCDCREVESDQKDREGK